MTVEALTPVRNVNHRQSISPNHLKGSFVGDDTDNHDFVFRGQGKVLPQLDINNAPDAELTWSFYGMHEEDGAPGDPGTYLIDTWVIDADDDFDDAWFGYAFPFFLLRLAYAVAPTDDPYKTVSVYINLGRL